MPNGKVHFKTNVILGFTMVAGGIFLGADGEQLLAISTGAIAGTLITCDYDLDKSMPKNILTALPPWRWLWKPYRKMAKHRGIVSHTPFLSTGIRAGYLLVWTCLFALLLTPFGVDSFGYLLAAFSNYYFWGWLFASWSLQDCLHIFLDFF